VREKVPLFPYCGMRVRYQLFLLGAQCIVPEIDSRHASFFVAQNKKVAGEGFRWDGPARHAARSGRNKKNSGT
jgi:hypothetical protein